MIISSLPFVINSVDIVTSPEHPFTITKKIQIFTVGQKNGENFLGQKRTTSCQIYGTICHNKYCWYCETLKKLRHPAQKKQNGMFVLYVTKGCVCVWMAGGCA